MGHKHYWFWLHFVVFASSWDVSPTSTLRWWTEMYQADIKENIRQRAVRMQNSVLLELQWNKREGKKTRTRWTSLTTIASSRLDVFLWRCGFEPGSWPQSHGILFTLSVALSFYASNKAEIYNYNTGNIYLLCSVVYYIFFLQTAENVFSQHPMHLILMERDAYIFC